MFKKVILVIILIIVFVCLIQLTKESILGSPQRIYNKIYPKYRDLVSFSAKDIVYSPKRTLTYALRYMNMIPMGRATMSAQTQGRNILLKAVADTPSLVTKFYKAQAQVQSLIDKNKLYPLKYTEITTTPEKERKKVMVYNHSAHIMEREGIKYKIPDMTFCPVSAIYYLQTQDLKAKEEYVINLISKEEIYLLKAEVIKEQGNILKVKGSVRREDLSSTHGATFIMWFAKDLRIPLLYKVSTRAGILTLRAIVED